MCGRLETEVVALEDLIDHTLEELAGFWMTLQCLVQRDHMSPVVEFGPETAEVPFLHSFVDLEEAGDRGTRRLLVRVLSI